MSAIHYCKWTHLSNTNLSTHNHNTSFQNLVEGHCQTENSKHNKAQQNNDNKTVQRFTQFIVVSQSSPTTLPCTSIANKSFKHLPLFYQKLGCFTLFAASLQKYVIHGQMLLSKVKQVAAGTIQLCYNENMRWLPLHSPALMRTVGVQHYNGLMKTGNGWH